MIKITDHAINANKKLIARHPNYLLTTMSWTYFMSMYWMLSKQEIHIM